MDIRKLFVTLLFVLLSSITMGQTNAIKNHYGIPEELTFNNASYKLNGSYHPNDHYYKQEYIPVNEKPEHYNTMLIIDFYVTDEGAKWMLQRKETELAERRKSDPVVTFKQFENDESGEYMLDFILSDSKNGELNLVERNVYRYKAIIEKSGKKGVLLIGISQRGYGDGINSFFTILKANRINDINTLGAYSIPDINVKN